MDPGNCLMEILALRENQEGIRIRRSPGDYVEHLPWVLKRSFRGPCVDRAMTSKVDAQAAECEEVTADV